MEKRVLGRTGMEVSVLGFGAAEIGFSNTSSETVANILSAALDSGVNVIDTAECYMNSEELIGQTFSNRRNDFHLFTKCGHDQGDNKEDWRKNSLLDSIRRSLARLRTDHLDLVLLHSCSEAELVKGDAVEALIEAREKGYTRFIGYSGDNDAAASAVESGEFDVLEISVNVADQIAIDTVLPQAKAAGLGVIAKRPLANAAWRTGTLPENEYHHEYWRRLRELKYDFLERDLPEAIGVALRFTLAQSPVHTAIVGTTNIARFEENASRLAARPGDAEIFAAIRDTWRTVAKGTWLGQV